MKPLKILITNLVLVGRSGTETHVRDLALGLLKRGAVPMIYSPHLGPGIAEELQRRGVEVVDDPKKLSTRPDVIHGQHNLAAMVAMLAFPDVPACFVCHDAVAWHDAPPRFPTLQHFVAVDQLCRERLTRQCGVPESQVSIIGNSVDLERFQPRGPLPARPRRALMFSNYVTRDNFLPVVESACRSTGLALEVRGGGVYNVCLAPEDLLGDYDLVFAKARCAMEAMAVGTAVVLCGVEGTGPLVTPAQFDHLLKFNFGRGVIKGPWEASLLVEQIKRYDVDAVAEVSRLARQRCSLDGMVEQWLRLYKSMLVGREELTIAPAESVYKDLAGFLKQLEPPLFSLYELNSRVQHLQAELQAELQKKRPGSIALWLQRFKLKR